MAAVILANFGGFSLDSIFSLTFAEFLKLFEMAEKMENKRALATRLDTKFLLKSAGAVMLQDTENVRASDEDIRRAKEVARLMQEGKLNRKALTHGDIINGNV